MDNSEFYLKSVEVEGYKSLRRAEIDFQPGLNIIIGANGSGKTNFLEYLSHALDFAPKEILSQIKNDFFSSLAIKREIDGKEQTHEWVVKLKRDLSLKEIVFYDERDSSKRYLIRDPFISYKLSYFLNGREEFLEEKKLPTSLIPSEILTKVHEKINFLLEKELFAYTFQKELDALESPANVSIDSSFNVLGLANNLCSISSLIQIPMLLASIYDDPITIKKEKSLTEAYEDIKSTFLEEINALVSSEISILYNVLPIKEVRIRDSLNFRLNGDQISIENLQYEFLINGQWHSWLNLSDGTKRIFLLCTEILLDRSSLFLLEEPELGIHPHQLHLLMQFIKEQSERKQIILTTHSPQVLDILSPDELNRIIIAEMTNDGTKLRHMSKDEIAKAHVYMKDEGFLSDYWKYSDLENFVI